MEIPAEPLDSSHEHKAFIYRGMKDCDVGEPIECLEYAELSGQLINRPDGKIAVTIGGRLHDMAAFEPLGFIEQSGILHRQIFVKEISPIVSLLGKGAVDLVILLRR